MGDAGCLIDNDGARFCEENLPFQKLTVVEPDSTISLIFGSGMSMGLFQ